MLMTNLIQKKKDGIALNKAEIDFFVNGYVEKTVQDYQISALLMAIYFKGMNSQETTNLTLSMVNSGETIDLSHIPGIKVDKHSTGGVADTTTLIIGPLVAACGGLMAKMSGRGLGHTGGTIDKLESIPGFKTSQTMEQFSTIINQCGFSIIGQTGNLVPADKKLYALRDVTATVDNMSLIASSVMSKKIAAGSDKIVLDVKYGSGAFMKDKESAATLGQLMVDIGKLAEKETYAFITSMEQPLGNAVGNTLEVIEAIEILQGKHEGDLKILSIELAAKMLVLGNIFESTENAKLKIHEAIQSGKALEHFEKMIKLQSGDPSIIYDINLLPKANQKFNLLSDNSGYITKINTEALGHVASLLGAGRTNTTDVIDNAVGYWMKKRIGDTVSVGDTLAELHINKTKNVEEAMHLFKTSIIIDKIPPNKFELIYKII